MPENQESSKRAEVKDPSDYDYINTCTSCEHAYRDPNRQPCFDCLKGQPYHLWEKRTY